MSPMIEAITNDNTVFPQNALPQFEHLNCICISIINETHKYLRFFNCQLSAINVLPSHCPLTWPTTFGGGVTNQLLENKTIWAI